MLILALGYLAFTIPLCLFVKQDGGDFYDVILVAVWPLTLIVIVCIIFTSDKVIEGEEDEDQRNKSC